MEYQVFLTYIVLALIVAVIIGILFNLFRICSVPKSEGQSIMTAINSAAITDTINKILQFNSSSASGSHPGETTIPEPITPTPEPPERHGRTDGANPTPTPTPPPSKQDEISNKIPNNIMSEGDLTKTPISGGCEKYTKDELQQYRDDFFGFRSHCWQSSGGIDMVDKINDALYTGNGEISKPAGCKAERICDVYDSLTSNNYRNHCVMNQNLDNVNKLPQYKISGNSGNYLTRDNWMYNYDHVMNGALFYDGVTGMDPLMDNQMAL